MESQRSSYALFSYDKNNQDFDKYMNIKRLLEKGLSEIQKEVREKGLTNEMFTSAIRLDEKKYLTACCYKDRTFVGISEKGKNNISFDDKKNHLADMTSRQIKDMLSRMRNDVSLFEKYHQHNMFFSVNPWKQKIPVMNKIIEYENELNNLSEKQKEIIHNSGEYDRKINEIIKENAQAKKRDATERSFDQRISEAIQEAHSNTSKQVEQRQNIRVQESR